MNFGVREVPGEHALAELLDLDGPFRNDAGALEP
jgi:hypothetical protein